MRGFTDCGARRTLARHEVVNEPVARSARGTEPSGHGKGIGAAAGTRHACRVVGGGRRIQKEIHGRARDTVRLTKSRARDGTMYSDYIGALPEMRQALSLIHI